MWLWTIPMVSTRPLASQSGRSHQNGFSASIQLSACRAACRRKRTEEG